MTGTTDGPDPTLVLPGQILPHGYGGQINRWEWINWWEWVNWGACLTITVGGQIFINTDDHDGHRMTLTRDQWDDVAKVAAWHVAKIDAAAASQEE